MPLNDRTVEISKLQPTEEQLVDFSKAVGEDWTNGVVVIDENMNILVHKSDLKCEGDELKN